jgi:hypothetical protein
MTESVKETNDQHVLGHINCLVAEEHSLYHQEQLTDSDRL